MFQKWIILSLEKYQQEKADMGLKNNNNNDRSLI